MLTKFAALAYASWWPRAAAVLLFGLGALSVPAFADSDSRLTMGMRDASLNEVMEMLARQHRVNILLADDVDATVSFSLYDVKLDEAVRSIASAAGYMVEKRKDTYFILPEDQAGKTPGSGFTIVKALPVRYTDAAELETKLGDYLSDFGNITAVPDRNLLMIEDQPAYVYRITQLLEELDRRPAQVLIEAKLLEVRLNDEESFGIDWATFFSVGNGDAGGGLQGVGAPGTSGSAGFFFDLLDSDYEVAIRALERDGRVRNLASPKVVTLVNKEAEVIIGDRQGYPVTTTINQVTSETIEFLESGTILRVTPNIDESGQILLTIHPEVSNGTIDDRGIPSQTTTEVTTQLLVPSGRSIFIGGLMRSSITETEAGIPVLGKIPGLRWAFGSRSRTTQNTETVVVITPRLLDADFLDLNDNAIQDIESTEHDIQKRLGVIEGYVEDAFPLFPNRKGEARDEADTLSIEGVLTTEEGEVEVEPGPAAATTPEREMMGPVRDSVPVVEVFAAPAPPPVNDDQSTDPGIAESADSATPVAASEVQSLVPVPVSMAEVSDAQPVMPVPVSMTEVSDVQPAVSPSIEAPAASPASEAPAEVAAEVDAEAAATPAGRYALNLHSAPLPIEELPIADQDAEPRLVYVTETELEGETWYRLRVGFFATEAEAEIALDEWLDDYPSAWLVRVGPQERANAAEPQTVASATP